MIYNKKYSVIYSIHNTLESTQKIPLYKEL